MHLHMPFFYFMLYNGEVGTHTLYKHSYTCTRTHTRVYARARTHTRATHVRARAHTHTRNSELPAGSSSSDFLLQPA